MKSALELRQSLARLKQAVVQLEIEILALEPTTTTLTDLIAELPNRRAVALVKRAALARGCQPEHENRWTIQPLMDMTKDEWLCMRNCGVVNMNAIWQTLEQFRAKA